MTPTAYITENRDAKLAREILDVIEDEEARKIKNWEDWGDLVKDGHNAWNQGTWGEIWLNELPASTDIEALPLQAYGGVYNYRDNELVSISGGLSCGTAMCFAGHAVNMVGDRPVFNIDKAYTRDLHTGKMRKNLKRWMSKVGRQSHTFTPFRPWVSATISTVLTPEGQLVNVSDRAQELLGLSFNEADALFNGGNDLPTLRKYVARMEEDRNIITGRKKGKDGFLRRSRA